MLHTDSFTHLTANWTLAFIAPRAIHSYLWSLLWLKHCHDKIILDFHDADALFLYQQRVVYSIAGRLICVAWMSSSISLTLSASTLGSALSRCLQKCLCLNIPDVWSEELRGCEEEAEEEEGERGRRDDKGLRTETAEGRRSSRRCSLEYLLHWNWNVKGSVTVRVCICVCVLPLCAGRLAQVECPPPRGEGKACVCGWGVTDGSRLSVENHRDVVVKGPFQSFCCCMSSLIYSTLLFRFSFTPENQLSQGWNVQEYGSSFTFHFCEIMMM